MKNLVLPLVLLQIMNGFCQRELHINQTRVTVSNGFETLFGKYVQRTSIDEECQFDISLFLKELKKGKLWALKMMDASAKVQSGILEGNIVGLGFFDECIGIEEIVESRHVMGKYCLVGILPSNSSQNSHVMTFEAVCLPSSCSISDIGVFLSQFNISIRISETSCQTRDTFTFDTTSLLITIFFGCVLFLVMSSTIYEVVIVFIYKGKTKDLYTAFSIVKNAKKIFTVTESNREITCIYGIRVFSISWIILLHLYSAAISYPMINKLTVIKDFFEHNNDFVIGGTKAVDTFFLISGLMVTYSFLSTAKKNKFNLLEFYVHRYLRLTPALGAVILVSIGLVQFLSSGPAWYKIFSKEKDECLANWWKTILYINNYDIKRCVGTSWFLSVDMQLYLLSPIILLPLSKKPKVGLCMTIFFMLCAMGVSFVITWIYDIGVDYVFTRSTYLYHEKYYFKTYTRAAPWFMGILLGYLLHKAIQSKNKISMNPLLVIFLWTVSIVVLVLSGLFAFGTSDGTLEKKLRDCFYNAFVRPLWCVAVAWVIFACYFDYGGFVNSFLSLPIFRVLSRLTYTNYLTHYLILWAHVGRTRSPMHYSKADLSILFWGIFMYTQFASIILSLAFEYPMLTIDKLLFTKTPKKRETSDNP